MHEGQRGEGVGVEDEDRVGGVDILAKCVVSSRYLIRDFNL